MKKEFEKEIPTSFAEGAISVLTVLQNSSRPVEAVYLSNFEKLKTDRKIFKIKKLCEEKGIPFEKCTNEFIEENTIGSTHGGIIAKVGDREYKSLPDVFKKENGFVCLLDGIEDPYNFAYSIRSLFASGVDAVVLSERNWMSATGVVIRGSAGASELVDCSVYTDKDELIKIAKENGYKIVSADENTDTLHTDEVFKKPLFLIVGGEKRGISRCILNEADQILRIDYGRDFQGSLSTASAATVMAFEILRQNS
jgi:23S rRNA (guanosine2251-2'-O)-methyltransferase